MADKPQPMSARPPLISDEDLDTIDSNYARVVAMADSDREFMLRRLLCANIPRMTAEIRRLRALQPPLADSGPNEETP